MNFNLALLGLAILLTTGCVSTKPSVLMYAEIKGKKVWRGNAAVISSNKIITAYHVINIKSRSLLVRIRPGKYIRAEVLSVIYPKGAMEPYVILKVYNFKFKKSYIYRIAATHLLPHRVYTHRGTFSWASYVPKGGDSGSPVVNKYNKLIGIVYGHRRSANGVIRPIYTPLKR